MTSPNARIDLHGLDSQRATAAILRLIDTAQAQGNLRIEIVHGRGAGILAKLARDLLKGHPKVTDIGALDANAGCGVWARIRKVSAMPAERLPLASGTQSATNARDLLKEAKSLDLPTPLIPATETPRERKL